MEKGKWFFVISLITFVGASWIPIQSMSHYLELCGVIGFIFAWGYTICGLLDELIDKIDKK